MFIKLFGLMVAVMIPVAFAVGLFHPQILRYKRFAATGRCFVIGKKIEDWAKRQGGGVETGTTRVQEVEERGGSSWSVC